MKFIEKLKELKDIHKNKRKLKKIINDIRKSDDYAKMYAFAEKTNTLEETGGLLGKPIKVNGVIVKVKEK